MLSIELISLVLKEIALLRSKDADDIERGVVAGKFVLKVLHTFIPKVGGPEGAMLNFLHAAGLFLVHAIDISTKIDKKETLLAISAILELIGTIVDELFEMQTEEEPAGLQEVVIVIATLEILNGAIDVLELIYVEQKE